MRIGVFGGTFDPVHNGHLVAAREVGRQLSLDKLLMVVAGIPWQKVDHHKLTDAEDRFAMVEAALADGEWAASLACVEASRMEIDRGGSSYTADTLAALRRAFPQAELVLVVGTDVAADIHTWEYVDKVISLSRLAVVTRRMQAVPKQRTLEPGCGPTTATWNKRRLDELESMGFEIIEVSIPFADISSSDIRERVAGGLPITGMVPRSVERFIKEKGLYDG
ncbi:MAG: nicotinate-nucleotide adenylyltransferase [Actinobacteria bacterium]|nr:nicotinate-nucleotide adenylyltransferase [Actinomycetota bacterium]MCL5446754.1 nicotinate-nucleotide adenylyltransferase [Actinomycetota bacterium]